MSQITFWWAVADLFVLVWMIMLLVRNFKTPAHTMQNKAIDFVCFQVCLLIACAISIELVGYIKQ